MSDGAPRRVHARAWCRADLAGGTLDIWPIGLLCSPSCTINVALDLAVEVTVERRPSGYRVTQGSTVTERESLGELESEPETALIGVVARYFELPPVTFSIRSQSPRGGGLGGSSALVVALIAAVEELLDLGPSVAGRRSALARDFEAQLMSLPTGRQDHFPALLGGVLRIDHRAGGEEVKHLDVDLEALGASLIVAYSGQSHFSAGNNWKVVRRCLDGDAATMDRFKGIASTAHELSQMLEKGDLAAVGSLMTQEWTHRRGLAPGISTTRIEDLLAAASRAGAWGGKACGAGGGGCLVVLAPSEKRRSVESALSECGAERLEARPVVGPIEIIVERA